MKNSTHQLFLGAAVAIFFSLTFTALAQEKPTPPAEPASQAAPAVTPTPAAPATPEAAPAAPAAVEPAPVAAPADEPKQRELRRLDATPAPEAQDSNPRSSRGGRRGRVEGLNVTRDGDNAIVSIAHDSFLAKDQKADAVISVFGSSTSEGEVADAVVSVIGNTRVTGPVGDAAVAVLGSTYVNNKVGDAVVAVLGDVELGPDAEVGGDVVSIGGTVTRDPKAIIHGHVQNVAFGGAGAIPHFDGIQTWFRECLLLGRPLAFSPHLGFAWGLAFAFFALYALIALVFRSGVDKCVTTLETRPGASILAAILSILLTPVLIVLLCITVIGIAAVPFLALGLIAAGLLGKTVMLAWVGRRITKFFGDGPLSHTAVAVLVGGAIVLLLYCVPFVGMLVQKSFDLLGFGVVIFTLMLANKREKPVTPPRAPGVSGGPVTPAVSSAAPAAMSVVAPTPPAMPMMSSGFGSTGIVSGAPEAVGAAVPVVPAMAPVEPPLAAAAAAAIPPGTPAFTAPPLISASTSPRAGFMIRLAALLLDFILVGIIAVFFLHGGKFLLVLIAAYAAVMWKLKGTTIGGIVCGLKVVRLDDREIDWATAIVRALGCFLSLAVVGLGFLWVAIDDDKQSWHDKIAGTTVVRLPKGVSLL